MLIKLLITSIFAASLVACNVGASSQTSASAPKSFNCQGSYIGNIDMPPHDERITARNEGLRRKGLPLTGNDDIDNAAQGGGAPDGGMWLSGNFDFNADSACNVTGKVYIFGYPFDLTGQVQKDGNFTLNYLAPLFIGKVNSDSSVTGKLMHGGGEEYIYGYINGRFTQRNSK